MRERTSQLLITDLDNTLWDWFGIWHATFRAFLDKLSEASGMSEQQLLPMIKEVHERHGTSEYAFVLQELDFVRRQHDDPAEIVEHYSDVIEAHRAARKKVTKLYPGVLSTLERLRDRGVCVVAYTESMAFYTARRLLDTQLDGVIEKVYSPPDHDLPAGLSRDQVRSMSDSYYRLKKTQHHSTPTGVVKPSPEILSSIISDAGFATSECVYVGDSLTKDVAMAKNCGVVDVWAAYGESHKDDRYALLRAVTHWTPEQVETEAITTAERIKPSHSLSSFSEIEELFPG